MLLAMRMRCCCNDGSAAALQRCTPSLRGIRRGQLQMSTTKKSVTIKRGKARLFRDGNPLVYGGAVERTTGSMSRGDAVEVVDGAGNNIGWGFYNPDSMYRVRLLPGPMADDPDACRPVFDRDRSVNGGAH